MDGSKSFLNRRAMLATAAAAGLIALLPLTAQAAALTGVDALDTPSILVKSPASVLLVAITRAGNRLVAVGEHGVIIYSDDDGVSWTQGQVPVNVTLTCVAFATPQLGWAAGHFGAILVTADGGKTWTMQLNGLQANQLTLQAAQDPSVASSTCPCAPLAVARAAHFMDEGPDKPFLSMLVLSPQHVMVFGAYRMTMVTTDGGKTWADWSLHIYDKYSHNIYGAAVIGADYYLCGEQGLVFCSTDAGNTFLPLAPTTSVTLFGILGARDGSLVVFGVAGACLRSTDGGKSWTTIALASQDDITSGRVLRSGTVVLITEAGALFKSTDNGATFTAVPGVTTLPFFDIEEAAGDELIIVGGAGVTRLSEKILNS
ncbi:hypothetical protein GCM10010909_01350 [Acidocella aquatica]|uniref:Photosynthesis system II assembly factor Ycf48/Hcf136-like domain-containing protein n=1 Tax=Acidocella aquatica TaxID=1922313 RepID=A0ABQ6A2C2_9PROT|nr:hypothetical protein [Acidocella aquatica]GLR65457.1 hypothetical protein GCM10010909_01350 [Acidocella aquatica]